MYDTLDELIREIEAGEDSLLDLKEVVFSDSRVSFAGRGSTGKATAELAKDLCCFANSDGGVIVFGVQDDGERVGLPKERMSLLQELVINVAQNNVEPPLGDLLLFDRLLLPDRAGKDRLCLKLEIRKARFALHAPLGRRPYWRIGDQCHPMALEQQARAFEQRGLISPIEERPVFQVPAEALESRRFEEYYRSRFEQELADARVPEEALLQNLKLLAPDESGELHPTVLGLLLFSSRPERWIPGAYVDLAVYSGAEPDADRQVDTKTFRGTLVEQIERTMDYLKASPYLPRAARKDGLGRIDQPAYSYRAIQEGIVNALVHRDYGIAGSQVRVFLFPDRIEISNPGRLPNNLTPKDLFAGCQPVRRNQMLAGFLRDFISPLTQRAYMEARGEGFLTLVRECEKLGAPRPELRTIGDGLRLTIFAATHERDAGQSDDSDFEVQVVRNTSGDLEVQVLDSPRDRHRSRFVPPYSAQETADLLASLERLLERRHDPLAGRATANDELPDLERVGGRLFASIFPPPLRATLDSALSRHPGLRLRVSIDPEDGDLAHVGTLPWELLYHPERQFLARRADVSFMRYLDVPVDLEHLFVPSQLRVLLVAPAPVGCKPVDLDQQQRWIEEILGEMGSIDVRRVQPPTVERLIECLEERPIHVVHYLGHGGWDESVGESGLFFESQGRARDVVRSGRLADRLAPFFATLRLVVLNTSLSARGRQRAEHAPFGSVSSALIARGLPAVLGMQFSISKIAAERFTEAFYRHLAATGHVETATAEARREIYRRDPSSPEWMIPIVVSRAANGRLFDPGAAPSAGEPLRVGIRSIFGWGVEIEDWSEAFLPLTSFFRGRRPLEGLCWHPVYDRLATFLRKTVAGRKAIHLDFAAHLSLAFATGYLVDVKSGIEVTVRQRSARGTKDWSLDDPPIPQADSWEIAEHPVTGGGDDLALAVSCTRSILTSVRSHLGKSVPNVGRILDFRLPEGPGQLAVRNGRHAFRLAEAIDRHIHDRVPGDWPGILHLFYAGPNGLLFFLGQLSHGPRRIQLYEYDFDAQGERSYTPSLSFPLPAEAAV